MTAKVVSLVEKTGIAKCRADAIELLEQALDEARNGEIVAVAIACVTDSGAARVKVSEADNAITLLGAVARTMHPLHAALDQ